MGKLAEVKTKPTTLSVEDFINSVADEQKRNDSFALLKLMQKATKAKPVMWGTSLIGFGYVIVKSPSGREVEWFKVGFSPRKANLSVYLLGNMQAHADALKKLGKHKTGGGCLYINKLADVDTKVLEQMINNTLKVG
jgi:hypothetical protein